MTASVEYGIHGLLWLIGNEDAALSRRDLAELQCISPSFLAKIFQKLDKAGIVKASEGVRGGYRLASPADEITLLSIVDTIEGDKPLFECQEIRGHCAVFGNNPPGWATSGVCAVHAAMMQAEKAMRESLASQTLGGVAQRFGSKAPQEFFTDVQAWIGDRMPGRTPRGGRPPRDDQD